jgi:cytochrome P450
MTPLARVRAPGPPALPYVGHVPAFLHDRLGFLSRCAARYGDVVRLEIGGRTYLVSGPDDIKHVLVSNSANYEKTARLTGTRGRAFFGDGLVTARGQMHLRQRRMMQPAFHHAVIDRFGDVVASAAEQMLARWGDDVVVDIHHEMLDVTQRITARALFGSEPTSQLDRFREAVSIRRRYQEYLIGSVLPLSVADRLPTRLRREQEHAHLEIDAIVDAAIRTRRASAPPSVDLLSMLVHARHDDGPGMSDVQIRDEVRTLALAGYETIAEALTWTWYLLGESASAEAAVAEEVADLSSDGPRGISTIASLPYCRMVLAEAMRLYPPTWLFVRVAQDEDVLPSGVSIGAGSKIYLSQWVIHRNPRYFPDPERFDPQRFTDDAIRARPRFTYLPFGAGRRLCIGEDFAWMQGVLIMASVARRYHLRLLPGQVVVPQPNVTLRPRHGIRMRTVRR